MSERSGTVTASRPEKTAGLLAKTISKAKAQLNDEELAKAGDWLRANMTLHRGWETRWVDRVTHGVRAIAKGQAEATDQESTKVGGGETGEVPHDIKMSD